MTEMFPEHRRRPRLIIAAEQQSDDAPAVGRDFTVLSVTDRGRFRMKGARNPERAAQFSLI
jgi:hypothetical protein